MVAVVAVFDVDESKTAEFEAEMSKLAAAVRANEPDNRFFQVTKARKTPGLYKVLELYASKEALQTHGGSDWFKQSSEAVKPYLKSDPVIEILQPVD